MHRRRLKTNFSDTELSCRCGCGKMPEDYAIIALQNMRQRIGRPLIISSGARCPKHHRYIYREDIRAGKQWPTKSKHLEGHAFDISCMDEELRWLIVEFAIALGFTHIRIHKDFVHVDMRDDTTPQIGLYI